MRNIEPNYQKAHAELITLLGLPPGTVVYLTEDLPDLPDFDEIDFEELEKLSLQLRPELVEQDMEEKITVDDARQTILRMFPNVELFASYNYDTNTFLLHNYWIEAGARAAFEIMSLANKIETYQAQRYQAWFQKQARLTASAGIIAQVYIAYIDIYRNKTNFDTLTKRWETREELARAGESAAKYGTLPEEEAYRLRNDAFLAKVARYEAYARMQADFETLANAVGKPLLFLEEEECHAE